MHAGLSDPNCQRRLAAGLADRALPAEIATSHGCLAMTWRVDVGDVPNRVTPNGVTIIAGLTGSNCQRRLAAFG